ERRTPLTSKGNAKTREGQRRLAAAKAEVRGRSGGWCEASSPVCPPHRHPAVHAHHVTPRSQGGKHEAGNLLDVCAPAHLWIHEHPAAASALGLLGRRAS